MKKLILLLFLCYFNIYGQNTIEEVRVIKDDKQIDELFSEIGPNELKLDILDILSQPALQITYEKIKDPYSSFGADIFLNFSDTNTSSSWSDKLALTPFYRFYFFDKRDYGGSGFFAEVFSKFSFAKSEVQYYYGLNNPNIEPYIEVEEEDFFDVALGAAIGQKWVNKKGWTFELSLGFGRYLFVKDPEQLLGGPQIDSFRPTGTGRGGFSIGKRF
jgi:hypothetical protein